MLSTILLASSVLFSCAIYLRRQRASRVTISAVPGPEAESYLLGNLRQLMQNPVGHADFQWQEKYGPIFRVKAPFGEDRLVVADPKALRYIFQSNPRNFQQPPQDREILRTLLGAGIAWADGDVHRRHRRAMTPAFAVPELKALIPIFHSRADRLTSKLKDIISAEALDGSAIINMPHWLSRSALDVIGEAAFGYEFGALDDLESELGKAYDNVMSDAFSTPSTLQIFGQGILCYIPSFVVRFLLDHLPANGLIRLRSSRETVFKVARQLVREKKEETPHGKKKRDVMSALVRANASQNPENQLTDDELLAEMATIMFAGHETTATTLTWALWELAKHPEVQARLRREVRELRSRLGSQDVGFAELESVPYLQSVVLEVLRLHPAGYHMVRQPRTDDILPLHTPITLTSGLVVTELPIPEGSKMIISVAAYHRNQGLWGPDAHEFNPDRWMKLDQSDISSSVGVIGNLMTFSAGLRSCLGWRFAMWEVQAFLINLMDHFEFLLTADAATKIRREACLVMVPMIEGEAKEGVKLPLTVKLAENV